MQDNFFFLFKIAFEIIVIPGQRMAHHQRQLVSRHDEGKNLSKSEKEKNL